MQRSHSTRRSAHTKGLVFLAMVGICCEVGVPAWAQTNAPESAVQRTYLNKPTVSLPVEIDGNYRTQLKSLELYMKEGAQGNWSVVDRGQPQQTAFVFRAPREGEYWFRIVAVDNQGRSHPSDLNKDPQESVVVVIDTTAPVLEVNYLSATPEGTTLQCEVRDANSDLLKTRFFYQTQDQVWRPLDPIPGRPAAFCIPPQAVLTNLVKVMATDLAGNATTRTLNLGELAAASNIRSAPAAVPTAIAAPPQAPTMTAAAPVNPQAQVAPLLPPVAPVLPPALYAPSANSAPIPVSAPAFAPPAEVKTVGGSASVPATEELRTVHDLNPAIRQAPTIAMPTVAVPTVESPNLLRPSTTSDPLAPSIPNVAGTLSRQSAPNLQIVNNPIVLLNYTFENVGASGVGKIEIWASADQRRTWTKLVDDPSRKNPAEIRLPGEGVYGLKLVVANGRGYGAPPPQSGDPEDWLIEVDTTRPKVNITGVRCGTGVESGLLTVLWQAEDKNLAPDGIELLYAPAREGPWTSIAKGLHNEQRNEGQYRWTPPAQAGAQAFLRLVVRDRANNTAISETVQPVPLDDLSRPRVRLLSVTPAPQNSQTSPTPMGGSTITPVTAPGTLMPVQAITLPYQPPPPSTGLNLGPGVEIR